MAQDMMIVRVRPGETRIARTDGDGRLQDFALYRDQDAGLVGDVFLGRVKKVVPAMEAAFIDIGGEREGFLGLAEARPQPHMGGKAPRDRISDYLHEGQAVMVQVLAAARDAKGVKLTRRVNVTGAFLVLTLNDPGIRVSKRIGDDGERNRLRALLSGQLQDLEGCVIRSGAKGADERSLHAEVALLRACWAELEDQAHTHKAPMLLSGREMPAMQFLTQHGHGHLARIIIDDPKVAKEAEGKLDALGILPSAGVERHMGGADVFEASGVADQVVALLEPLVKLPNGGSIIIEETAALTTIDVNAGRAGAGKGGRAGDVALSTNLEAVKEVARQMRLRNLAGLIVIDIISMSGKDGAGRVVTALKDALAADPASPHVLGTTKGGLLELTRPRRRPPLSAQILAACPTCHTGRAEAPLSVAYRALDQVLAEVWAQPALIPVLRAPSQVIHALQNQGQTALDEIEAKLGQPLDLIADDTMAHGQFHIESAQR